MAFVEPVSYLGLFVVSFLAATILPFSSEIALGAMLKGDFSVWMTLCFASLGNVLGAVVNYWLGIYGSEFVFKRILRLKKDELDNSLNRFQKYGTASLLFAWVPVIGDPLTVAAGVLKINFPVFVVLVAAGKILRYLVIAWAVLNI